MYPVNELLTLTVFWTFIDQIYQGADKDSGSLPIIINLLSSSEVKEAI